MVLVPTIVQTVLPGVGPRHTWMAVNGFSSASLVSGSPSGIEYGALMSGDELRALRVENALLKATLERHGITLPEPDSVPSEAIAGAVRASGADEANWDGARAPDERACKVPSESPSAGASPVLSPDDKVRLFRSRFAGREDVYALRWESNTTGKSGYAPARVPPWQSMAETGEGGFVDHEGRHHLPLTGDVVRRHLLGEHVVGLYPLDSHSRCRVVVADFDDGTWADDARAFAATCADASVPVLMEISRSGEGAHAWVFFDGPVPSIDARRLVAVLLERTCAERRLLSLSSYDRLIPGQDALPPGGFGTLVALPLQREARRRGASVFVDAALEPFDDPWTALADVARVPASSVRTLIERLAGEGGALDPFADDGDESATMPWRPSRPVAIPAEDLPATIRFTLADGLYVAKAGLPLALVTRFTRLAAFSNPTWHERQRQHRSVWDCPRFVDKARNLPHHVWLPRGCLEDARTLVAAVSNTASAAGRSGIEIVVADERAVGTPIELAFAGTLRPEQETALETVLAHDTGVLVAPPGFGKTVTAAAVIAARATSTLVLVHRKDLLRQWRAQLATFLGLGPKAIGVLGGGKATLTGRVDVAVVQALVRHDDPGALVAGYGQVIIDECHHAGAQSIDALLAAVRARYVLGLTATPERRDGLHPLVFQQCGPIRHRVSLDASRPLDLSVRFAPYDGVPDVPDDTPIQTVLSALAEDRVRTAIVVDAAVEAWNAGRKVLLLTERKGHVDAIEAGLRAHGIAPVVLHGGLSPKRRDAALAELDAFGPDERRCLLATGRLVGEGFDHPPLDTLILALPLSWRGTLEQYVGRLHRPWPGKADVRVVDVDDRAHPMLASMKRKREAGYRALSYRRTEGLQLF